MTTSMADLTPTERTIVLALRLHSILTLPELKDETGHPSATQLGVALRTLCLARIIVRTETADGDLYSLTPAEVSK